MVLYQCYMVHIHIHVCIHTAFMFSNTKQKQTASVKTVQLNLIEYLKS